MLSVVQYEAIHVYLKLYIANSTNLAITIKKLLNLQGSFTTNIYTTQKKILCSSKFIKKIKGTF